jgi:molybdate transport system regulatory protein
MGIILIYNYPLNGLRRYYCMATSVNLQISGRNKLRGKVINIIPGIVTAEVEIDIGNGNRVVGVITKRSLEELEINLGDEVTALIKATSVMFIKE